MTIRLPEKKRTRILKLCESLRAKGSLSLKEIQVLGGNLNHASIATPGATLRTQWIGRATTLAEKNRHYVLGPYDKIQLSWWIDMMKMNAFVQVITPIPRMVTNIWSDASDYFGGALSSDGFWLCFPWSPDWLCSTIATKELATFIVAVMQMKIPRGRLVRGFIDNSTAWWALVLHKSHNIALNELMRVFDDFLRDNDIILEMVLISSEQNSRQVSNSAKLRG